MQSVRRGCDSTFDPLRQGYVQDGDNERTTQVVGVLRQSKRLRQEEGYKADGYDVVA